MWESIKDMMAIFGFISAVNGLLPAYDSDQKEAKRNYYYDLAINKPNMVHCCDYYKKYGEKLGKCIYLLNDESQCLPIK